MREMSPTDMRCVPTQASNGESLGGCGSFLTLFMYHAGDGHMLLCPVCDRTNMIPKRKGK